MWWVPVEWNKFSTVCMHLYRKAVKIAQYKWRSKELYKVLLNSPILNFIKIILYDL